MANNIVRFFNIEDQIRFQPIVVTPPPPLWTPAEITTTAWYDADDAGTISTESGGAVSQWDDKSGNGYHMTQGTGSSQPTTGIRSLNGLNVLDFSDDFMTAALNINRSVMPDITIFAVFAEDDATTGSFALFGQDNGSFDRFVLLSFDTFAVVEWGATSDGTTEPLEATRSPDTDDHILSLQWDDDATDGSYVCLDGNTRRIFTEAGDNGTTSLALGAIRPDGFRALDGYIAEFIVIDSLTDLTAQQKMEGYLAHKWGVDANLPVGHPYKLEAPTV